MLAPGTLVDRYELVSPVGEGGMAQVWVARQKGKHGFEKLFAFKCIHPRFAGHPAFRSMFLDEARIAASIEHPNVAQIFDLGESESMLYLVMEYVDGESLGALMAAASRRVNDAVPVPTPVALRIIADACAGLHAAHSLKDAAGETRGVVHRDVSPQNILVSVRGDVKVIDFGIAVAKDRIGGDTEGGSLKGKLHYMAPEQALREPIGPFTDVYAMGATLYRMLAGQPPHDGGNDAATLQLLLSGRAAAPLHDGIPPLVNAIVERAISFDPGDRYTSAAALQTAIEAAIADEGYVPDVVTWVASTLSDATKERRAHLATRTLNIAPSRAPEIPSFVAELGPAPDRARPTAPVPADPPRPEPAPAPAPALAVPEIAAPVVAPIVRPAGAAHERAPDTNGPGIMDVRALVARASLPDAAEPILAQAPYSPPRQSSPHPSSPRLAEAEAHATPARELPRPIPVGTKKIDNAGTRGGGWTKLAVVAVVFILVLAGVLLLLPMIARDRIIASAGESGIELTIDRVGIGLGGVALRGVTAKVARVPSAEIRADEIFATGFSAREVRVRGLDVKLAGDVGEVGQSLLAFYEANRGRLAGGGAEPRKISIVSAHLAWAGFLGEGTGFEAGEIGTDFESRGVGTEDIRANLGRFELKTKRTTLGPWAGSFERNAQTSRLRVVLDPPVPDGPNVLVVWGKASAPHLTVRIARSPLARLGIRPADLGLPADPGTELEMKLEGGQSPNGRIEGACRLDLFGVRLRGLKSPVDVKVEGSASGLPGKPIDLEKTTVTLGPFLATVTGTLTATDLGFRLDAAWRTLPVSCEKLARAEAKSMGPIAAALQDIAHATGAARVTGNANASGVVKYDTKSIDEATATLVTREACGLSIFGM